MCTSLTARGKGSDKSCAVTAFHQPQTTAGLRARATGGCCSLRRELQGAPFHVSAGIIPSLGPAAAKAISILLLSRYVFVLPHVLKKDGFPPINFTNVYEAFPGKNAVALPEVNLAIDTHVWCLLHFISILCKH